MGRPLDAKIVVVGHQGVGKSSLVLRYVHQQFNANGASTIGASFLAKKVFVDDTQWDTAGQERFRSMAPMYYRGAHAAVLCYDVTSYESFEQMGTWLTELRTNMPEEVVIHIVGTKTDLVQQDPRKREVPFETSVAFAAQNLGLKGQDACIDACHEVSAKDGEGVEELFHVITRKLVEHSETIGNVRSQANYQRRSMAPAVHITELARKSQSCCG